MNVFFVVLVAVGLLLIGIALYARKQDGQSQAEHKPEPLPSKQIGGQSRPVESLSTNDAREWLDSFLLEQQSDTKDKE